MSEIKELNRIAQIIYDKKGVNILALDVRPVSQLTDYVLIAEGAVDKHVVAIAQTILTELKGKGQSVLVEGLAHGDWVVLVLPHIMVHLFMPGMRDKYSLEELWKDGDIVDLNILTSAPYDS
jgi:ribosome-associated protein